MDAKTVKREFIRDAIARATVGHYPIVEPSPEDLSKDFNWWLKVFDAKAFLFSENGSATWLFPMYQLKLRPLLRRVVVSWNGTVLVDSTQCFEFVETAHPVQIYIPKRDVNSDLLRESSTLTYCPFKNMARYYSLEHRGTEVKDAFWSYEDIYSVLPNANSDGILAMQGMLSPDRTKVRVEILEA